MKISKFTITTVLLIIAIVTFFAFVMFRTDIRKGDATLINYTGKVDGKEFEGGSATNYSLVIGSNSFIAGFEDQIIGHKAGDEFDVNVTFPSDYAKKELANKAAVFKVKVVGYYKPTTKKTYGDVTNEQLKELKKALSGDK